MNAGGPTAAQTIYPILNRNYDDLGWSIAVLPSAVTVASMKETRGMDVVGGAPTLALAEARSGEYQAFAQSLRDMALLEATMQQGPNPASRCFTG